MFHKYKKFQQMRKQAKDMQSELATVVCEGSAAWGNVKVTVNGNRDLMEVKIDPKVLEEKDVSKLEKAIKEAYQDATGKKFQLKLAKKMQEMGGMDLFKQMGGE